MGESKRRAKSENGDPSAELASLFARLGISTDAPGFYDSPAFLRIEQRDPSFLDRYAEWVARRPRDPAYDEKVRAVVPVVAEVMARRLHEENLLGLCGNAATSMARVLDRLGV